MQQFLVIVLCLTSKICLAQTTVRGTVKDVQNVPLQNATLTLLRTDDSILIQTTQTDIAGHYEFKNVAAGDYFIKMSAVGKKESITLSFVTKDKKEVVVPVAVMLADNKMLQNVTVTATGKSVEAIKGKLIYNIDKSISASGSNAFELLRRTPGITVDGEENILLKGSNTINIMIDGKMSYLSSQQLSAYLKSLPAENLIRIEVISTPSSQYDAAGSAGIINIVTKKLNRQGYAVNVSAGAGAGRYAQTTESVISNIRTKTFNFFGSYNYTYNHSYLDRTSFRTISTNGKLTGYDRRSFDPSFDNNHAYKAGIDFYLNKNNELGVVYNGSSNRWQRVAGGPTYLRNASGIIDSVVQNKNRTIEPESNKAFNIHYKLSLDTSGNQLTMDADYAAYKRNSFGSLDNGLYSISGVALQPYQSLAFRQPGTIVIHSFKVDAVLPFKNWTWKTGAKYAAISSDNDFVYDSLINGIYVYSKALSNHFIYSERIIAGYLSASRQLTTSLLLDAGARIEHTESKGNSITSNIVTPRAYINFFPYLSFTGKPFGDNILNVAIARRINRPLYANLNPFRYFFDKYSYVEGNPYLQPELSWNGSVSYTFKQEYVVTANYSRTNNAMLGIALQDSASGTLRISTYNFSFGDAADILIIAPLKLTAFWKLLGTIDVSYLSYLYDGGKALFHPRHVSVDLQTTQSFTLPCNIAAELTVQYTSPTISGVYVIKRYFIVNAGLKKSFIGKLDVTLAIADIFRTDRYWGYSIYALTDVRYDHRVDSRRVKLAVAYHFGGKLSAGKTHRLEEQDRL